MQKKWVAAGLGGFAALVLIAVLASTAGGSGGPSALADQLDSKSVPVFGSIQGVGAVVDQFEPVLKSLPPSFRKAAPDLYDPARRVKLLGFDPMTSKGLADAGIDPTGSLSIAFDSRVVRRSGWGIQPLPILLLTIADLDKLKAVLKKLGAEWPQAADPTRPVVLDLGRDWLAGQRGSQLALVRVMRHQEAASLFPGFEAFMKGGGESLGSSDAYRDAFRGAPSGSGRGWPRVRSS